MALQPINPPGASIPGISQAMAVDAGRLLFLSGHVPLRPDGSVSNTLETQLTQVFENLKQTLAAAGADFANVARLTIYVRNYAPEHLETIRTIRDRYVDATQPPASALIGVASLFRPDVLVEVDAIAALSS